MLFLKLEIKLKLQFETFLFSPACVFSFVCLLYEIYLCWRPIRYNDDDDEEECLPSTIWYQVFERYAT